MADANAVELFTSVTGASKETAAQYLEAASGNVDAAVATFFESPPDAPDTAAPETEAPVPAADGLATVDSIVGSARDAGRDESGAQASGAKGGGKGGGLPENARTVAIVFFADGFMVDEEFETPTTEEDLEPTPAAAPAPVRRTGIMKLDDFKQPSSQGRPQLPKKLPKLAPLRSYDTPENKAFLDQIKAGRLPKDMQKRDENGQPIPVSIALEDVRPKTYEELSKVIKEMEKMRDEMEREQAAKKPKPSTLFTGAGHSLSFGTTSASGSGAAGAAPATSSGAGAEPALVALLGVAAPAADDAKIATTLQLRLSTGARVKLRLNLDHTVADIWRHVAAEMGLDAFKAASGHELVAGFPPKPLVDPGLSLEAADLKNAAVSHRYK